MALTHEFVRGFVHLLFPAMCNACGRALAAGQSAFCPACRSALFSDPFAMCPRCAGTAGPYAHVDSGCTHCRGEHFSFEAAVRLGPYGGLLRDVVVRLKHSSGEGLAENLAAVWADYAGERLRALDAEVVVPVPLHWWRRLSRGYNQSEALARTLAERLGLPVLPGAVRRIRATPMQTRQSPTQRRVNVRGAFRARGGPALRGKSVLLVDDVMTTGSTCNEAAKALREAGAARVVVAVLARGGG